MRTFFANLFCRQELQKYVHQREREREKKIEREREGERERKRRMKERKREAKVLQNYNFNKVNERVSESVSFIKAIIILKKELIYDLNLILEIIMFFLYHLTPSTKLWCYL